MDKESFHNSHSNDIGNKNINNGSGSNSGSLLLRASSDTTKDLVLQWGNRKRLRCMKVQVKDPTNPSNPVQRTTVRVDRRVARTDNKDSSNNPTPKPSVINHVHNNNNNNHHHNQSNGYRNLRQRQTSPQQPTQRILRILFFLPYKIGIYLEGQVTIEEIIARGNLDEKKRVRVVSF
ncbi:PREDICTED: protein aardvark-like [Lupinus angustifolius]|uniref:protein aardvark-like n=1 Tax=Lupinus angustifolius TaxID=3871 RepID=UPI00092F638E|nr:PREDICTED: protein aardvark-like [Lupinus angustifolius]